jgi:hypothetical protein
VKGRLTATAAGVLAAVLGVAGCGGPGGPSAADPLRGGVVATFAVGTERFNVWIRNGAAIEQVRAVQRGASAATIPNGRLVAGVGQASHNRPYSWHLDPDEIEMAEAAIELCDGSPSFVERNRDQFIREVGRYCPWGARLIGVVDHR